MCTYVLCAGPGGQSQVEGHYHAVRYCSDAGCSGALQDAHHKNLVSIVCCPFKGDDAASMHTLVMKKQQPSEGLICVCASGLP